MPPNRVIRSGTISGRRVVALAAAVARPAWCNPAAGRACHTPELWANNINSNTTVHHNTAQRNTQHTSMLHRALEQHRCSVSTFDMRN